jgi:hypothetical protein
MISEMHYFEIKNFLQVYPLSWNTKNCITDVNKTKNLILNQFKDLKLDFDSTKFFSLKNLVSQHNPCWGSELPEISFLSGIIHQK